MPDKPTYKELKQSVKHLEDSLAKIKKGSKSYGKSLELLDAIRKVQSLYIVGTDRSKIYQLLLKTLVDVTESEYGFLDEVCYDENGEQYKKNLAISDISWDEKSKELFQQLQARDMKFTYLDNLSGLPALTGKMVISNDPICDPRSKGLPEGHPPIRSYLGVPLFYGGELICVAGVANRKNGYDEEIAEFLQPLFSICAGITRALQKEVAERERETRFANLVKNLPGIAYQFILSPGGVFRFAYMGDNSIDLFGYTAEEILADANLVFHLIPQPDADLVNQAIQHSAETLEQYDIEHRVIREDGRLVWIHATSTPQKLENGDILWDGIGLDITKRKQSEKALQDSEERFRRLTALSPGGIYETDANGNCVYANRSWLEMTGLSLEAAQGKGWINGVHPDDREHIAQSWYKMVASNGNWGLEYRIQNHKKVTTWVYGIATPIIDNAGNIAGYMGLNIPITEKKKAEEKLVRTSRRLKQAHRMAKLGHWDWDMATGKLTWSEEVFKIFGRDKEDFQPTVESFEACIHPEDYQLFIEEREAALAEHRTINIEHRIILPDGIIRYVRELAEIQRDENGEVIAVSGTVQDISVQKAAELKIKSNEENLRKMTDTMQETLSVINLDGDFLYANKKATHNMSGGRADNILGVNIKELVPKNQAETLIKLYREVYRSGKVHSHELPVKLIKGEKWFFNTLKPIEYGYEKEPGVLSVSLDISGRIRSEQLLKESEHRLELALEAVSDAIWDWRIDTDRVNFSPGWYTMLGYEPYELPQDYATWKNLLHPEDQFLAEQTVARHLELPDPFAMEFRMRTKTGQWKWILGRGKTVERDAKGNAVRMIGTNIDITERKKVDERLRRLNAEIKLYSQKLEKQNIALNVLLDNRDNERRELGERILANFDKLVFPYFEKVLSSQNKNDIETYIEIIKQNTHESLASLERKGSQIYDRFTPTEIQVADLVKAGKASKEIAAALHLSLRAVYFHRNNIRNKLGLQKQKMNLRSFLLSQ